MKYLLLNITIGPFCVKIKEVVRRSVIAKEVVLEVDSDRAEVCYSCPPPLLLALLLLLWWHFDEP